MKTNFSQFLVSFSAYNVDLQLKVDVHVLWLYSLHLEGDQTNS